MVVTVIAPAGLGKTTFTCMQLPAYYYAQLKNSGELDEKAKIHIINTDGSFLLQRFQQVLQEFNINYKEIRNNTTMEFPYTAQQQENAVKQIFRNAFEAKSERPVYIVVDPFNHILRMEFAKADPNYRLNVVGRLSPRLEHQMQLLQVVARKFNAVVVLTVLPKKKHVEEVPKRWQNAFFGPTEIAHLSDVVLWFSQGVQAGNTVTVHVLKHRLKETPYHVNCRLTKGGLVNYLVSK